MEESNQMRRRKVLTSLHFHFSLIIVIGCQKATIPIRCCCRSSYTKMEVQFSSYSNTKTQQHIQMRKKQVEWQWKLFSSKREFSVFESIYVKKVEAIGCVCSTKLSRWTCNDEKTLISVLLAWNNRWELRPYFVFVHILAQENKVGIWNCLTLKSCEWLHEDTCLIHFDETFDFGTNWLFFVGRKDFAKVILMLRPSKSICGYRSRSN